MTPAGLPHSDIRGSLHASCSPRRFAGCCVLLRLSVPRHPPCALHNLLCFMLHVLMARSLDFFAFALSMNPSSITMSIGGCPLLSLLGNATIRSRFEQSVRFVLFYRCFRFAEFTTGLKPWCRLRCLLRKNCFKLSKNAVDPSGLEPLTSCLQNRCSSS